MTIEPERRAGGGDEYDALELPDTWHVVSLLCFAGALGSKLLVSIVPPDLRPARWGVLLPVAATLLLSAAGLACGLVAMRRPATRAAGRIATFLNAVVLGLTGLATLAFFGILRHWYR